MTVPASLIEAGNVLIKLRGFAFAIKEAEAKLPAEQQTLPSATEISKCLLWGATALEKDSLR